MRNVELTKISDESYLNFGVWAGYHTVLEIEPRQRTLCLSAMDFLSGLYACLDELPRLEWPAVYRPVGEVMRRVNFEEESDSPYQTTRDIPLDGREKMACYGNGLQILVPVRVFADAAVRILAASPKLDLAIAETDFQDRFLEKWSRIIRQFDNPCDFLVGGC